ncbi:hypothetical protein [Candidatus Enterococcus testudinis]|uniref:hypothetical protein n=1 Tax=Candidatus Enterococcus testudinis TaxID=1834191 RepID=UPI000A34C0A2|nr:hypothetical protein [Enterococcus sp. 8G7_MSG3316]
MYPFSLSIIFYLLATIWYSFYERTEKVQGGFFVRNVNQRPLMCQVGILIAMSIVFLLPQIIGRGMILGSDVVFHFNRFYETSQQIKEGNFQYFLSIYGFQQSGRIVNALYGPFFAYFQGLLVLLSHSWYQYQLLSNGLLYLLSGLSMFGLLRKLNVNGWLATAMGVFYMSTYSVQYWIERQGFSAWGAAVLPLCLIPLIALGQEKKLRPFAVGVSVAVLFQIHVFSSIMLVLMYVPFFLRAFFGGEGAQAKKQLLWKLSGAIGLFLLLTANIWLGMADLYLHNQLLAPFINHNMQNNTITGTSSYWWSTPILLPLVCGLFFCGELKVWPKLAGDMKLLTWVAAIFFVLATNFIPWTWLGSLDNGLINLIQFPFRFFVPATVLIIAGLCLLAPYYRGQQLVKPIWVIALVVLSSGQVLIQTTNKMLDWRSDEAAVTLRNHTYLGTDSAAELKAAYFSTDKSLALDLYQRSTPDYVPIYQETTENKYDAYGKQIIEGNNTVVKSVEDGKLTLRWQGDSADWVQVPIINYRYTELTLNQTSLTRDDIQLSTIGVVTLQQRIGANVLVVDYDAPWYFDGALWLTMAAWLLLPIGYAGWWWHCQKNK